MNLEAENAHEWHRRFSHSDGESINTFEQLSQFVFKEEVSIRRGVRLSCKDMETFRFLLKCNKPHGEYATNKVLAAELFPDDNPPKIVIAESELELHDKLRERNPSEKPRISGDIIYFQNLKFFMCDGFYIDSNTLFTMTKKNYHEIANLLLDNGYIPVDAKFKLLPNHPIQK